MERKREPHGAKLPLVGWLEPRAFLSAIFLRVVPIPINECAGGHMLGDGNTIRAILLACGRWVSWRM